MNANDTLDMEEVGNLLEKMGVTQEEKRKQCIAAIDPNNDGKVTFEEFRNWTRGREQDLCIVVGGYV